MNWTQKNEIRHWKRLKWKKLSRSNRDLSNLSTDQRRTTTEALVRWKDDTVMHPPAQRRGEERRGEEDFHKEKLNVTAFFSSNQRLLLVLVHLCLSCM
jgi:hypothetical protein